MTGSSRRLLEGARALPEDERLQLASEILACVEGPPDTDWDASWLAELDRRFVAGKARGDNGSAWSDVRSRLLKRLGCE